MMNLLTIPWRVWKSNYYTLPRQEQEGVKIVFTSYLIMLLLIIIWIASSVAN